MPAQGVRSILQPRRVRASIRARRASSPGSPDELGGNIMNTTAGAPSTSSSRRSSPSRSASSSGPGACSGTARPRRIPLPAGAAVIYGVWLVPAVLGGLVIRKPGAALFTETVAALGVRRCSARLGLDRWSCRACSRGSAARAGLRRVRVPVFRLPVALLGRRAGRGRRRAARRRRLVPRHGLGQLPDPVHRCSPSSARAVDRRASAAGR